MFMIAVWLLLTAFGGHSTRCKTSLRESIPNLFPDVHEYVPFDKQRTFKNIFTPVQMIPNSKRAFTLPPGLCQLKIQIKKEDNVGIAEDDNTKVKKYHSHNNINARKTTRNNNVIKEALLRRRKKRSYFDLVEQFYTRNPGKHQIRRQDEGGNYDDNNEGGGDRGDENNKKVDADHNDDEIDARINENNEKSTDDKSDEINYGDVNDIDIYTNNQETNDDNNNNDKHDNENNDSEDNDNDPAKYQDEDTKKHRDYEKHDVNYNNFFIDPPNGKLNIDNKNQQIERNRKNCKNGKYDKNNNKYNYDADFENDSGDDYGVKENNENGRGRGGGRDRDRGRYEDTPPYPSDDLQYEYEPLPRASSVHSDHGQGGGTRPTGSVSNVLHSGIMMTTRLCVLNAGDLYCMSEASKEPARESPGAQQHPLYKPVTVPGHINKDDYNRKHKEKWDKRLY